MGGGGHTHTQTTHAMKSKRSKPHRAVAHTIHASIDTREHKPFQILQHPSPYLFKSTQVLARLPALYVVDGCVDVYRRGVGVGVAVVPVVVFPASNLWHDARRATLSSDLHQQPFQEGQQVTLAAARKQGRPTSGNRWKGRKPWLRCGVARK